MKIAIITDTHSGVRGDSSIFLDHQEKFFQNIFFPKLERENIDTVLHLGDVFDRRRFINFVTLKRTKEMLFEPMKNAGITCHAVLGNHDCYYKNTNDVNALELVLKEYENWHIYSHEPKEMVFGSSKIMLSPWIAKDNYEVSMKMFEETDASILMGHFEFQGFEMMKGQISDHGFDKKDFFKFESVYSGHFHHPSENGNVKYLGAPYEMNWSDYDGKRGFHIFDTETKTLEFIPNTYKIFHKIEYDDEDMTMEDVVELDTSVLENTFIKLIVKNKTNPQIFDLFCDKLSESGCADLKIIEDALNLEGIEGEELIDESKDTKEVLHSYVDGLETNVDKSKVKGVIDNLYSEAMSL